MTSSLVSAKQASTASLAGVPSLSDTQEAFRERTRVTASKWNQLSPDEVVLLRILFVQDALTGVIYRTDSKLHAPRLRGKAACRLHESGYRRVKLLGKSYAAHRIAWALNHREWPTLAVDHINGNRADNRIENLRLGSIAENCVNRAAKPNSSSKFKGVSFVPSRNKWRAYIRKGVGVAGRRWLGEFKTEEQAAAAYRAACIEMYGEFARFE